MAPDIKRTRITSMIETNEVLKIEVKKVCGLLLQKEAGLVGNMFAH